ncbi:hypothetical protein JCM8202v2_005916 [Rhodotorula sphaerocarpa]
MCVNLANLTTRRMQRFIVPALCLFGLIAYLALSSGRLSSVYKTAPNAPPERDLAVDPASPSSEAVQGVLQQLLHVPQHEVGGVAICASLRNEGRWLQEWLLYHRAVGVDRFYLYDSGSTDDTLVMLQPWIGAGTVKLFSFSHDQAGHYQTAALETCSRTFGPTTDWLLEADLDEYHVPTPYLAGLNRSRPIPIEEIPDQPVRKLLFDNWLYKNADVIVVSRVSFKNIGHEALPGGASSLVHTKKAREGWIIPGAHRLKHQTVSPKAAKIITADGHEVEAQVNDPGAAAGMEGTAYHGQYSGVRVFEPLVLYHYEERDLEDCYRKLKVAQKLRKGGWRDKAGSEGCKKFDVYQSTDEWVPLIDGNSFYGGANRDLSMAESWFGRHLPALIAAAEKLAQEMAAKGELRKPELIEPHPALVEYWAAAGLSPVNGMPLEEA